jgi:hypothetical protein
MKAKKMKPRYTLNPPMSVFLEEAGLAQYSTAQVPRFPKDYDDANPPKSVTDSPYYWWFRFLQLNERYRKTEAEGGRGRLATIYADFGDVYEVNFRDWWETHFKLFAEPLGKFRFEIARAAHRLAPFDDPRVLNVVVPLTWSREKLREHFERKVINLVPEPGPGQSRTSTKAKYRLEGRWNIEAMRNAYNVYRARQADAEGTSFSVNSREQSKTRYRTPWSVIALRAEIKVRYNKPNGKRELLKESDRSLAAARARNSATTIALRHYRNAEQLIAAAASRRFPGPRNTDSSP